jgi:hypothetical protein
MSEKLHNRRTSSSEEVFLTLQADVTGYKQHQFRPVTGLGLSFSNLQYAIELSYKVDKGTEYFVPL